MLLATAVICVGLLMGLLLQLKRNDCNYAATRADSKSDCHDALLSTCSIRGLDAVKWEHARRFEMVGGQFDLVPYGIVVGKDNVAV